MPKSVIVRWLRCKKTLLNLIYAQISYFRANECLYTLESTPSFAWIGVIHPDGP